ncbi:unnamed protein product, partial [Polarella glacialis]
EFMLGLAYLKGNGVPKDTEKGEEFLRRAADQGDEMAKDMLSDLASAASAAEEAKTCPVKNHMLDVWASAAASGDAAAQFNLGLAYLK